MDIERMFQNEVRDKKRTASGVYHRASRRGYIRGGVKTQSDFLTKKEKDKLNGEVKVYNMYDKYNVIENVPQINEIERMPKNDRVNLYKFLKDKYPNVILQKHWNISSGSLYNKIYEKYNLYTPRTKKDITIPKISGLYKSIEEIPSIKSILDMTNAQRKGILVAVKQQFSAAALSKYWNISKTKIYTIYHENELISKKNDINEEIQQPIEEQQMNMIQNNNVQQDTQLNAEDISNLIKDELKLFSQELYENIKNKYEENTQEILNGFKIEMNGTHCKNEIENKLLSIANILSDEKKYKILFKIEEI